MSIVTGAVLGLGAVFGWRAWTDYTQQQTEQASAEYAQLQSALDKGDADEVIERGKKMISEYRSTPYSDLAALALAKLKLERGDAAAAAAHLQWVLDHAKQAAIERVARLRLARVLLSQGEIDQALALLEEAEPGGFLSTYEELKGDLYLAKDDRERARDAYRSALDALQTGVPNRSLLQMKLDDLGEGPD